MSGKGDTYRKQTIKERQAFENNFDAIFGKKKEKADIVYVDDVWDEKRIDVIGTNGDGFPLENHYGDTK